MPGELVEEEDGSRLALASVVVDAFVPAVVREVVAEREALASGTALGGALVDNGLKAHNNKELQEGVGTLLVFRAGAREAS